MPELPFYQSEMLSSLKRVEHGFFSREGGVSSGEFSSLNCSPSSGDDPDKLAVNRSRVAAALELDSSALVSLKQIHSDTVFYIDEGSAEEPYRRGDGMITDRGGIGLGVLGADCAPVLFADAEAGVIGAAHAGWKGALTGICDAVVKAMCQRGAERHRICAAIGPAIQAQSYEVQMEFFERFRLESPIPAEAYFSKKDRKIVFDTPAYIVARLKALGLHQIDCNSEDTYTQPDRFFSFRRSIHKGQENYGRQISVIALTVNS